MHKDPPTHPPSPCCTECNKYFRNIPILTLPITHPRFCLHSVNTTNHFCKHMNPLEERKNEKRRFKKKSTTKQTKGKLTDNFYQSLQPLFGTDLTSLSLSHALICTPPPPPKKNTTLSVKTTAMGWGGGGGGGRQSESCATDPVAEEVLQELHLRGPQRLGSWSLLGWWWRRRRRRRRGCSHLCRLLCWLETKSENGSCYNMDTQRGHVHLSKLLCWLETTSENLSLPHACTQRTRTHTEDMHTHTQMTCTHTQDMHTHR